MSRNSLTAQSVALGKRLEKIPAELLAELRPALVQGAEEVADGARALVPVDEGDLRATITVTGPGEQTPPYASGGGSVTAKPNQALVTVGSPEVRHGHLIEFGTVHAEAQPYLRPAFRLKKTRLLARINRAVGKAIRKMGGR